MAGQNYRDLVTWKKAMDLVEEVYRATQSFPRDEAYGLTSQLRRAAISIPSNVAEGQGRGGKSDWLRFLRMAYGSLRELETQVMIAERLQYLSGAQAAALLERSAELGRLLNGLMKSLQQP